MPREKAGFKWYSGESQRLGLPPRCPIASADLCPRYFESLEALTKGGHFTEIPRDHAARLSRKWEMFQAAMSEDMPEVQDYPPERDEEGGEIQHAGRMPVQTVDAFCPEVSYDRFGYFASGLYGYCGPDQGELDRHTDHEEYKRDGTLDQWDSNWWSVVPKHYSECREYSIHTNFAKGAPAKGRSQRKGISDKQRWMVLARDSFTCQYCGRKPPEVALHVDHRVSVRDGGSDELENLVTSCTQCNFGKGKSSA